MFATIIECILDAMNLVVGSFRGAAARLFISKHKWEITIPPSCILDHTTPPRIAYLSYIRYLISPLSYPPFQLYHISQISLLPYLNSHLPSLPPPHHSHLSHRIRHLTSHLTPLPAILYLPSTPLHLQWSGHTRPRKDHYKNDSKR